MFLYFEHDVLVFWILPVLILIRYSELGQMHCTDKNFSSSLKVLGIFLFGSVSQLEPTADSFSQHVSTT